jgi:membrane-associated phospholipid phosphatase
MIMPDLSTFGWWHFITRLGEAQLLLPAALWACLTLVNQPTTRLISVRWLQTLVVGASLTLGSKLAFIGWGLGSAKFNFTGISGHAMFAAATYPFLTVTVACQLPSQWKRAALVMTFLLVVLICLSRIVVLAHSISEVVAGFLLGITVSAHAVCHFRLPSFKLNFYVPLILALWFLVSPLHTPQIQTHSMVTNLALFLSGHIKPHTRDEMLHNKIAIGQQGV